MFHRRCASSGWASTRRAGGQSLGWWFKLPLHQRQETMERRDKGEVTFTEIGRSYNVSGWTIAKLA